MWSMVGDSLPSILISLIMVGVGGNIFQTVNKASVAQHAPSELVGTVMGLSGERTGLSTGPRRSVESLTAVLIPCLYRIAVLVTWGRIWPTGP